VTHQRSRDSPRRIVALLQRLLAELTDCRRSVGQHEFTAFDTVAQIRERLRGLREQVLTRPQGPPCVALRCELWQRFHLGVIVHVEEEGERIPFLGRLAHSVVGRDECAGGPKFQHVADVDHEDARHTSGTSI
jgi:hypothetical protein